LASQWCHNSFYGWPSSYWGKNIDERVRPQRPDLVEAAVAPDYSLGSHVAALGLAFYTAEAFPSHFRGGAFIGEHGSWNRRPFTGYKVFGKIGPIQNKGRLGNSPFDFWFFPELMVQYDHFEGGPNKYVLFALNNEAMRVGPEAVLYLFPNGGRLAPCVGQQFADYLSNVSILATFHEEWDTYTGRNFYWAAVSTTYTFAAFVDKSFGVTVSYGYGNSETTGNLTNQVKLGFSAEW
jgi:hypothetical protein